VSAGRKDRTARHLTVGAEDKAVTPAPAGSAGVRTLHCLQMSNALHVPGDAATVRTAEGTRSPAYPRLVIATTIIASSLAFIDGSVVNVGLPAIGRSFQADAIGLQWVVNAYLLPLSAFLLLGGAAGDRYGRRRLLIAGVLLFGIASLARFVQGASAAMLMPNSLAILGQSFSGEAISASMTTSPKITCSDASTGFSILRRCAWS
jgi:Major Facilitator Superfamily